MDFKCVEDISDILRYAEDRLCGGEPSSMAAGAAHEPSDFDLPGRQLRYGLKISFSEPRKSDNQDSLRYFSGVRFQKDRRGFVVFPALMGEPMQNPGSS